MYTVGIDLGTTNTVCCTLRDGRYEFITFGREEVLPSVFLYQAGKKTFGSMARRKSEVYAANYISSSKTFMGDALKTWNIDGQQFNPTDVAAEILGHIYAGVLKYFGTDGREDIEAVITVPAYFTSNQIDETKKAGERAGFTVKRIVSEPVAAAIAYGHEITNNDERLFVFDLGGGTFDVSLLHVQGTGDNRKYTTEQVGGDKKLGGDDFDDVILHMILSELRKTKGINLASEAQSGFDSLTYANLRQKLVLAAEAAKKDLSQSETVNIAVANLFEKGGIQHSLDMNVTQTQFEDKSQELIDRIKREVKKVINNSDISLDDISRVILVGGSSQLPFVRDYVESFFNKSPYSDIDLSKIVAMGAAQLAFNTAHGLGDVVQDLISHSLGIEVVDERFEPILLKDSHYPITVTKEFTTVVNNQSSIEINVYEGEDVENVHNNEPYGGFVLDNIEIAAKGVPRISVTFEFDESRILTVTATDKKTGASRTVQVEKGKCLEQQKYPASEPFDIALLMDASSSMSGYKLNQAKEACRQLVDSMLDLNTHRLGIVSFDSVSRIMAQLTHDRSLLSDAVLRIYDSGSTNMTSALNDAERLLSGSQHQKLVIVVTDGHPDERDSTTYSAARLKQKGAQIVTIGVGSDVDAVYLEGLASSQDRYYSIRDMAQLQDVFHDIVSGLQTV
jgi:molecular chaperone DnaK